MDFRIRAVTLDLDDTVWPFAPVAARIEQCLHDWLNEHSPVTAQMFPIHAMRQLRERVFMDNPHLVHDLSALRRLTLHHALTESGGDPSLAEPAFAVFYEARNQVTCYPDSVEALIRISARLPLAALTNGNADLKRCGLDSFFCFQLGAREHGAAKPTASIFLDACQRLGVAPNEVLHVGDHIHMDVVGAMQAGLRGGWVNRENTDWPDSIPRPDLEFTTLTALADWLDAQPPEPVTACI